MAIMMYCISGLLTSNNSFIHCALVNISLVFFRYSGVIQTAVPARGQIVTALPLMMATCAHVETCVRLANVWLHRSLVTPFASSVMATTVP